MANNISYNNQSEEQMSSEFIFAGRLTGHIEPLQGEDGDSGTSVFFSDYEIDDDFYKDLIINKLENKEKIKKTDTNTLERGYINGDLILTPDKNVHRVIKMSDGKFDIEHVGRISNPRIPTDVKELLGSELKSNGLVLNISVEDPVGTCSIPNYFYFLDPSTDGAFPEEFDPSTIYTHLNADKESIKTGQYPYRRLNFKISSRFKSQLSEEIINEIGNKQDYEYFTKIYLKCEKKYSGPESGYDSNVFIKSNENGFIFYKSFNLPLQTSEDDATDVNTNVNFELSQLDKLWIYDNGFNSKYYFPYNASKTVLNPGYYYVLNGIQLRLARPYSNAPITSYWDVSVKRNPIASGMQKSEILPKQYKKIRVKDNNVYETFVLDGPRVVGTNFSFVKYGSRKMGGTSLLDKNVMFATRNPDICLFRNGDSASVSNLLLEYQTESTTLNGGESTYNGQDFEKVIVALAYVITADDQKDNIKSTLDYIFTNYIDAIEFILIDKQNNEKTIYNIDKTRTEISFIN